jgi:hypothetical protein
MPSSLADVDFPVDPDNWVTAVVKLASSPGSFEKFDLLQSTAGVWSLETTAGGAVLITGYGYALEKFRTGMTKVTVALPGSTVPAEADGAMQYGSLVVAQYATADGGTTFVAGTAANLADGKVVGRVERPFSATGAYQSDDIDDDLADGDFFLLRSGAL